MYGKDGTLRALICAFINMSIILIYYINKLLFRCNNETKAMIITNITIIL